MKLRNKITGEIVELESFQMEYSRHYDYGEGNNGEQRCSTYNKTLAELNEEWEDVIEYEPPLLSLDEIGLEVALGDYHDGEKCEFSWDEAMEIPKKVGNGWRLPTMIEWTKICNEVAATEDGGYDVRKFKKVLVFEGGSGNYWPSTVYSATYAHDLHYNMNGTNRNLYPQNYSSKGYAFAVRLVREIR